MRVRSGRAVFVVLAVVLAVATVGAVGFLARDRLLETWAIARLDEDDAATRKDALRQLERRGSDAAAGALLDALLAPPGSEVLAPEEVKPALDALAAAFGRSGLASRGQTVGTLLVAAERGEWAGAYALARLEVTEEAPLEEVAARLRSPEARLRQIAGDVLVRAWPRSQRAIERHLAVPSDTGEEAAAHHASRFFQAILPRYWYGPAAWEDSEGKRAGTQFAPPAAARAIAAHYARTHAEPEVRAVALSFAVAGIEDEGTGKRGPPDFALLEDVFAHDASSLVRTAAVHLVALAGPDPANLDLAALLRTTEDPRELVEVIQARTVWADVRFDGSPNLDLRCELWPGSPSEGFAFDNPARSAWEALPWSAAERARLEEILEAARLPELRDAASLALAGSSEAPPGFRVHEWGVWVYDALQPISIRPPPEELVRVGLVWRELDDAPVGVAALGSEAPEVRWQALEQEIEDLAVELRRSPLPALAERPLRIGPDGELETGTPGDLVVAFSHDGRHAALRPLRWAKPDDSETDQEDDGEDAAHDDEEDEPKLERDSSCILLADLDAKILRELRADQLDANTGVWYPTLSDDGRRLAFLVHREPLLVARVADSVERVLIEVDLGERTADRAWIAGDGTHLVFVDGDGLGVVDLDAATAKRIEVGYFSPTNAVRPSQDASRVVCVLEPSAWYRDLEGEDVGEDVYVIDTHAATRLNVSRAAGEDVHGQISADGTRVVFTSERDRQPRLYCADLRERRLWAVSDRSVSQWPGLAPGGSRVAFADADRLWFCDLDGDVPLPVPGGELGETPYLSGDGSRVVFVRDVGETTRTFVIDLER